MVIIIVTDEGHLAGRQRERPTEVRVNDAAEVTIPVNTLTLSRRQYDVLHIGSNGRHCDVVPTSFAHRPAVGPM